MKNKPVSSVLSHFEFRYCIMFFSLPTRCQIETSSSSSTAKSLQMELRESRAQAAIARKEKNAATTKATELKQALASVTKQNKVTLTSGPASRALTRKMGGLK